MTITLPCAFVCCNVQHSEGLGHLGSVILHLLALNLAFQKKYYLELNENSALALMQFGAQAFLCILWLASVLVMCVCVCHFGLVNNPARRPLSSIN